MAHAHNALHATRITCTHYVHACVQAVHDLLATVVTSSSHVHLQNEHVLFLDHACTV